MRNTRPSEITATPFWVRRHDDIAEAVFKAEPIKAKQNCAACHGDADAGRICAARDFNSKGDDEMKLTT